MKYLALWLGAFAAVLLASGLLYVGYLIVSALLSEPTLWWVPAIVLASAMVATIVATYDYLTEKRPPKAPRQ